MLENSAKEVMIGITNWYEGVNEKGNITIDDLARLKIFVDLSKDVLKTYKEVTDVAEANKHYQESFEFDVPYPQEENMWGIPDDEIPF
jgi:hypothetical protein